MSNVKLKKQTTIAMPEILEPIKNQVILAGYLSRDRASVALFTAVGKMYVIRLIVQDADNADFYIAAYKGLSDLIGSSVTGCKAAIVHNEIKNGEAVYHYSVDLLTTKGSFKLATIHEFFGQKSSAKLILQELELSGTYTEFQVTRSMKSLGYRRLS